MIHKRNITSSSKIAKDPFDSYMMRLKRMRRKAYEKRNRESKIRSSTSNEIYE